MFGIEKQEVRINHACLVGYDWQEYIKLDGAGEEREEFIRNFESSYIKQAENAVSSLQKKFDDFSEKQYLFDVFLLPVKSVQELRDLFNKEL